MPRLCDRQIQFERIGDRLERTVALADGREYVHHCTRAVYEALAHKIADAAEAGATVRTLVEGLNVPFTQVNVALEFLKERGCVVMRLRRNYPASDFMFEDAMVEFLALGQTAKET
ncbi:MAG: hypothetical protein HZA50_17655 [Planctomycetes bacterium]|nr:hypothetical protein [Planctomycetota bacterium]